MSRQAGNLGPSAAECNKFMGAFKCQYFMGSGVLAKGRSGSWEIEMIMRGEVVLKRGVYAL